MKNKKGKIFSATSKKKRLDSYVPNWYLNVVKKIINNFQENLIINKKFNIKKYIF